MKVLNLRCTNGHGFEGWFASDDEFMAQNGSGMIECPLCADRIISRLPSAPRLNLSNSRRPSSTSSTSSPAAPAAPAAPVTVLPLQTQWVDAVRRLMSQTDDVGERFPEEARRIHYGEIEARGIRGQASEAERRALVDEGIEIMSLPLPAALKGPVQ